MEYEVNETCWKSALLKSANKENQRKINNYQNRIRFNEVAINLMELHKMIKPMIGILKEPMELEALLIQTIDTIFALIHDHENDNGQGE
jgi:hypothetical protein